MRKQFGQEDWMGYEHRNGILVSTDKIGFGYFIRYCDCKAKIYLTKEELDSLIRKTNIPLSLKEILWERFVRRFRIPKIGFVIEWRRLEELRKVPLAREDKILALRRSGWTQEKIASKFGITRQRICQLLKKAKENRGLGITSNLA